MFRFFQIFLLLLVSVASLVAADPSEQFLTAYQSYQDGENLERSGNTAEAINRLKFAESLLLTITKEDPSWQQPVIAYRLKKTRESLDRLQGISYDTGGVDATLTTPPSSSSTTSASSQNVAPSAAPNPPQKDRQWGPSISITPPTLSSLGGGGREVVQSPKASTARAASMPTPASSSETRRLKETIEDLKNQLQEVTDALTSEKQRSSDLENAEWIKQRSQLTADLDVAHRKVSDLERDLKDRAGLGDQLKNLQKKLDDTVADKEAQEEQFQGSIKKLNDENTILAKQLYEAKSKITTSVDVQQKIDQLDKEVVQGKEIYSQLQAKFDHSQQLSKDALVKNDNLKKQLAEVTAKLVVAQKQTEIGAPLKAKIQELQAKVEEGNKAIHHEASLEADVQVLQEDRDRLMKKVDELGVAAAEASQVSGLTAQSQLLQKSVADLKTRLATSEQKASELKNQAEESAKMRAASEATQKQKIAEAEADRAVMEEEQARLENKVKQASLWLSSLRETADQVPSLQESLGQLKNQLAVSSESLHQSNTKLAEVEKADAFAHDEMLSKDISTKKLTDLLTQQNKSLKEELKTALVQIASSVDHSTEAYALQDQVKKLQEQMDQNAKEFAESQQQLTEFEKSRPEQEKALAQKQKALEEAESESTKLKNKLVHANQTIAALKQQRNQSQSRLEKLQDQLAERNASIAKLKKRKGNAADEEMVQENELLRGIVMREIKDEAKKAQAHRLVEEELKRLNVNSDTLQQQMRELAAPAVELTPQERALFKDAQLVVTDQGGDVLEASIAAPMHSAMNATNAGSINVASSTNAPQQAAASTNAQVLLWQGKFKQLLAQAQEEFDRQDYLQAENTFQESLKCSPNDYFALANYGVVECQLGKMKEAEEALKKASEQSSENSFALTTLGIVHYRQQHPKEAETALRKALKINDKDFTAHNYLGIVLTALGKGREGENELMKAVELNPNYADAHFNLAVIYATGKPPAKMLARKHYTKALELGLPPDASLDHILE